MADSDLDDFDFEHWSKLAQDDPEAFEALRQSAIAEVIASAPEAQQSRLRGLQWRVEQVRERSKTPLGACLKLSEMMWDTVLGANGLLESLGALESASQEQMTARESATVLPFKRSDDSD